jgi:mannosyltransferase OCH1-like enzyme
LVSFYIYNKNIKQKIPKVIIQTYRNKKRVPAKTNENIINYAPGYQHVIFDESDFLKFIKENYKKEHVDTFNRLSRRDIKENLFKYCYLYKYGGIYLDTKMELLKPIKEIFNNEDYLYISLAMIRQNIYKGLIASPPNNKIFLELIDYIIQTSKKPELLANDYSLYTKDFYNKTMEYTKKDKVSAGYSKNLKEGGYPDFYLFTEKMFDKFERV